ncbi:EamA family transporter [Nostoc sp.]|uniref:EamA family transporter n=1 Tax=Nostoc sp. TaxID=1180 RepID=UPI002FF830A0
MFTAWQLAIGGIILLPIALVVEKPLTHLSATNLLGFVYLGLVGTGLAYYMLWFRGIERLKATAVSCLGLMNPLVATLMGFFVLHQTLMPIKLIGAAIVLVPQGGSQKSKVKSQKYYGISSLGIFIGLLIYAAIALVSVLVRQQTNRLGDRSTTHLKVSS